MGKPTGFMEYDREDAEAYTVAERIKNYDEFHTPLSKEQQRKQGARCMECGVPFCQSGMSIANAVTGCPLNNLIPEWNDLIYKGCWEQAYNRLRLTNNFPEFTSRVCPALCEKACTCGANGDAVTVKANEYGIVENAYEQGFAVPRIPKVRTGKRIAVIGSGPSGLAAADQLNQRGHSVTVFERSDRVGGLLMYGIPNMKLEKDVIDRRVEIMEAEGIEFITEADVGRNVKASQLLQEYDRVILACGASEPRDIKAPGRDCGGIYFAVDFLKSTTKALLDTDMKEGTFISAKGKNVMVIGGGDTGNDCVGTSIRHGAKSVIQLEMMPKLPDTRAEDNPWPEWPRVCKTDYGQEEAIGVFGSDPRIYQTTVKEFIPDEKGDLKSAVLVKLKAERDKKTGRLMMKEIEGSEYSVDVDLVLIAAGFLGSESYVTKAFGVETDKRSNVASHEGTHMTNVENVFVCGDMHIGQSLVVRAIREGRDAAKEVDESLIGYTNLK
ncbi:MAG: glutamate synthase subunit beta [Ruminococcus sp.]|nr:glutamate synthase subunit beta [Ruminococcus sp.]